MTKAEKEFIESIFKKFDNLPCMQMNERLVKLEVQSSEKRENNGIDRENKGLNIRSWMLVIVILQLILAILTIWGNFR